MTIAAPKTPPDNEAHLLECEFVLEPMFQLIADLAEEAGWSSKTVVMALARLSAARLKEVEADSRDAGETRAQRSEH